MASIDINSDLGVGFGRWDLGDDLAIGAHPGYRDLAYVKPHGALYNTAVHDERQARDVVEAIVDTRIPAGSAGLAGTFSGVYPRESPGRFRATGPSRAIGD